jgi:hypothetical protein
VLTAINTILFDYLLVGKNPDRSDVGIMADKLQKVPGEIGRYGSRHALVFALCLTGKSQEKRYGI